jgi:hypothetical protein
MKFLTALISGPHKFTGTGVNHEGENFTATLVLQPLVSGSALMFHYVATRTDGVQVHSEATLLGSSSNGSLCLWPVMVELPAVLPHALKILTTSADGEFTAVFASGSREDMSVFREEITIQLKPSGSLVYAHSWGMPGGTFAERSGCEFHHQ